MEPTWGSGPLLGSTPLDRRLPPKSLCDMVDTVSVDLTTGPLELRLNHIERSDMFTAALFSAAAAI